MENKLFGHLHNNAQKCTECTEVCSVPMAIDNSYLFIVIYGF